MGRTIISEDGRFEWDEAKDRLNIKNHRLSFHQILSVFDDPAFLEGYDDSHSGQEERYYGIGYLNNVVLLITFYTERGARKRIISARKVDADEEEAYYDNFRSING
jgi:uncharacterized DUF497 family protein